MTVNRFWRAIAVCCVILIVIVPLFYELGDSPIYIWDEAIYANNSLDMAKTGNPLVLTVNGELNLYNVKPPFVIWLQAICIKVLGPSEFAVRLPSALAGLGTCIVLLIFAHKTLKNLSIGCLSVLVLITSQGYIRHHVTRTGDLDSVLVFWITLYSCLAIHLLVRKPLNNKRYYSCISVGIICAFLTKSVAGLMPLAGLFVAVIATNQLNVILRNRYFYICALITIATCIGFYILRELALPGYINVVFRSEYVRYFVNIMPWHDHPSYFYIQNMIIRQFFIPHIFVLPLAMYLGLTSSATKSISLVIILYCFIYLVVISIPSVKLEWYDAPLYPFLSLIVGIGTYEGYLRFSGQSNRIGFSNLIVLLGIVYFLVAYSEIFNSIRNNNNMPVDPLEREGYFMRQLKENRPEIKEYFVLMQVQHKAHLTQSKFYAAAYSVNEEYKITVLDSPDNVKVGKKYLYCQDNIKSNMNENYLFHVIDTNQYGCELIHIEGVK